MSMWLLQMGEEVREATPAALKALKKTDELLANKLTAVYKLADRHETGLLVKLMENGDIQLLPCASAETEDESDKVLDVNEAIVLAVEFHHILRNNPNISKLAVDLGPKKTFVYMYTGVIGGEAHVTIIILNARGQYLCSYDPTRHEFYPKVHGISPKPLAKYDGVVADQLDRMYRQVKRNIEEYRKKAGDDATYGEESSQN